MSHCGDIRLWKSGAPELEGVLRMNRAIGGQAHSRQKSPISIQRRVELPSRWHESG